MSQNYYTNLWHTNEQILEQLVAEDQSTGNTGNLIIFYVKYIQVANNLIECHDQIIHPQKREFIRKVMDLCIARILQLKEQLVNVDFQQLFQILVEFKLTPIELQIKVPSYCRINRSEDLQHRKELFEKAQNELFEEMANEKKEEEESHRPNIMAMFTLNPQISAEQEEEKSVEASYEEEEEEDIPTLDIVLKRPQIFEKVHTYSDKQAIKVQINMLKHQRQIDRHIYIGFQVARWPEVIMAFLKEFESKQENREKQILRWNSYKEAEIDIANALKEKHTRQFVEDLEDEIREWMISFYRQAGDFPPYPPEKPTLVPGPMQGLPKRLREKPPKLTPMERVLLGYKYLQGSALIMADQFVDPALYLESQKKGKKKENKRVMEKTNKKTKNKIIKKVTNEQSKCFKPLQVLEREYERLWKNLNELDNFEQKHVDKFIEEDKFYELSLGIRKNVDEFMQMELELLKDALWHDQHPKKKKRRHKKKKKKGKKRRKKKKKDPLEGKSFDDWIVELIKKGVIRQPREVFLADYCGDRSFITKLPIQDEILQHCILPLGSDIVHEFIPLARSVCLVGPEHNAKRFLSDVICTETGALLFDLSAKVMTFYKTAKELTLLLKIIARLAREMQPSVIFVDDIEQVFAKKKFAIEELNAKMIKKILKKLRKGIKAADRILVLGTCRLPWTAKRKPLRKLFDKFFYIPYPDYASHVLAWKKALQPYGLHTLRHISCLAKVTHEFQYPISRLFEIVDEMMNVKPMASVKDFIDVLNALGPNMDKNKEKFDTFLNLPSTRKKKIKKDK